MKKGFTLVELLIAMTIVVILSAMGLSIYSSIQKGGRDAKRKSDLAVIQSALEQYHADQGFYPFSYWEGGSPTCGLNNLITETSCGTFFTNITGNYVTDYVVTHIYINSLPKDPTGLLRYKYESIPASCMYGKAGPCTSYCLYAYLENSSNSSLLSTCPDQTSGSKTYNYEVKSP